MDNIFGEYDQADIYREKKTAEESFKIIKNLQERDYRRNEALMYYPFIPNMLISGFTLMRSSMDFALGKPSTFDYTLIGASVISNVVYFGAILPYTKKKHLILEKRMEDLNDLSK